MPHHRHPIDERDRRRPYPEEDFGQADYNTDYAYDERYRTGYRVPDEERGYRGDYYDERPRERHRRDERLAEADYHYIGERERGPRRRRYDEEPRYRDDDRYARREAEHRSWMDQARDGVASFFGADEDRRDDRRYRQARVLWAVIDGRLDHERGLDASDIEVIVDGSEVTLNGTVRSRDDKRRAEDLAEVRGVTDVHNNLRIRSNRGWWR